VRLPERPSDGAHRPRAVPEHNTADRTNMRPAETPPPARHAQRLMQPVRLWGESTAGQSQDGGRVLQWVPSASRAWVSHDDTPEQRRRVIQAMWASRAEIAVAFSDGEPAPGAAVSLVGARPRQDKRGDGFRWASPTRSRLRVVARQRFPRSITISRNSSIDSHAEGVTALERGGLEFEV
jgi:hypothetical protein